LARDLSFRERELVRDSIAGVTFMFFDCEKTFKHADYSTRQRVILESLRPVCDGLADDHMFKDVMTMLADKINMLKGGN